MITAQKHPIHLAAIDAFLKAGFKEGDVIPHAWFYQAFDLEEPTPGMSNGKAQSLELKRLTRQAKFEDVILRQHKICLESVPGVGYKIIPPRGQAKHGYTKAVDGIQKAIREGAAIAVNVDTSKLSSDERREHIDIVARMSMIQQMNAKPRRLSKPEPLQLPPPE